MESSKREINFTEINRIEKHKFINLSVEFPQNGLHKQEVFKSGAFLSEIAGRWLATMKQAEGEAQLELKIGLKHADMFILLFPEDLGTNN